MPRLLRSYSTLWSLTLGPLWEVPPGRLWHVETFVLLHGAGVGAILVGVLMLAR